MAGGTLTSTPKSQGRDRSGPHRASRYGKWWERWSVRGLEAHGRRTLDGTGTRRRVLLHYCRCREQAQPCSRGPQRMLRACGPGGAQARRQTGRAMPNKYDRRTLTGTQIQGCCTPASALADADHPDPGRCHRLCFRGDEVEFPVRRLPFPLGVTSLCAAATEPIPSFRTYGCAPDVRNRPPLLCPRTTGSHPAAPCPRAARHVWGRACSGRERLPAGSADQ